MIDKINIGIDVVNIKRFQKIPYNKKPSLYKKMFSSSEIDYCLRFKNSYEHFAGKFAIKEAVKKSLDKQISMLDIETLHPNSKPRITLKGKLKSHYRFLVSLSHEKNMAIAVVISENV